MAWPAGIVFRLRGIHSFGDSGGLLEDLDGACVIQVTGCPNFYYQSCRVRQLYIGIFHVLFVISFSSQLRVVTAGNIFRSDITFRSGPR